MKFNGLLILLGVLFLSVGVFADPTLQNPVITPNATNPLTGTQYFKFNIDINSQIINNLPTDFNSDSLCWYSVTDNNTMLAATFEDTTSQCVLLDYHNAQNGDFNFKMIVQNGQGDTNYENGWVHAWSDENAPASTWGTIAYYNGFTIIPVFARDGMTAQEDGDNALPETRQGSGVEYIWYSDNNGPWTAVPAASSDPAVPTDIKITGTGLHYVKVCAQDRLDTNSCNYGEGEWYKEDLRVDDFGGSAGTCNLMNLIVFVLIGVAIIAFLYAALGFVSGNVGIEHLSSLGISAIMVVIIIFITAVFNSLICVI